MGKRKNLTAEQIISKSRQAEVLLGEGKATAEMCRALGVTDSTYYKWRREYGGLKIDQAKRLKALEKENSQLRRAVADLTVDKLILQDAATVKS